MFLTNIFGFDHGTWDRCGVCVLWGVGALGGRNVGRGSGWAGGGGCQRRVMGYGSIAGHTCCQAWERCDGTGRGSVAGRACCGAWEWQPVIGRGCSGVHVLWGMGVAGWKCGGVLKGARVARRAGMAWYHAHAVGRGSVALRA